MCLKHLKKCVPIRLILPQYPTRWHAFPPSSSIMQVTYSTLFVSPEEDIRNTAGMLMSLSRDPRQLCSRFCNYRSLAARHSSSLRRAPTIIHRQSLKFPTQFDLSTNGILSHTYVYRIRGTLPEGLGESKEKGP